MQLVAENLCLDRAGRRILGPVSFAVAAGEALVLTGPNGAGKTSLIRAVAGFLPIAAGSIHLDDGSPDNEIAEKCHFVGHRDGIKGALTVRENAAFFAEYLSGAQADVMPILDRLGLGALAQVPAAWLSAGQRRRLGLSRLLLARRPLWLLDEPTVSLDKAAVEMLAATIAAHLATGGIVVAATHVPLGLAAPRELQLGGVPAESGPA